MAGWSNWSLAGSLDNGHYSHSPHWTNTKHQWECESLSCCLLLPPVSESVFSGYCSILQQPQSMPKEIENNDTYNMQIV